MDIHLDRLRVLVKKRSIGGWVLVLVGTFWNRLGDWQNVEWLANHLLPSAWPRIMLHADAVTVVLVVGGFVWLTVVLLWPKRIKPVVEPDAAKDSMYVELHYTFIYPKVGDLAFQLLEGKFKADGKKPEDVTTDCDLLVDVYAVNRSPSSLYVKDFSAWLEIGGEWCKLALDDNFHLDDVWSGSVEYGLENPGHKGEFDHYPSELPSLLSKRNAEIKPQEPIEGWLKFTAKDINPRTEYSIRLAIIDSLGREHHIDKFEKKERAIGLRKVKN